MPTTSHPNLTKPHFTSSWTGDSIRSQKHKVGTNNKNNMPVNNNNESIYSMKDDDVLGASSGPPSIQKTASQGSASLAYSIGSSGGGSSSGASNKQQPHQSQLPPQSNNSAEDHDDSMNEYSETMSAEQYYSLAASNQYNQYLEQQHQSNTGSAYATGGLSTVNEGASSSSSEYYNDATPIVHNMHRKLLHLLSSPNSFHEAIEWQMKVDRGLDPSRPDENNENEGDSLSDGIKSFENEFNNDDGQSRTTVPGTEESKDDDDDATATEDGTQTQQGDESTQATGQNNNNNKHPAQNKLIPPLPIQIFASDAEVVLPQALTASQLFGIERVTGIELEAAAGIIGLSQLFTRWLALMPEGDHLNVIDPPGLTVMRISGGRYRVTGAHRVVWRWMNKFSPASTFAVPSDSQHTDNNNDNKPDTDFDFGDLVTMTIIDVFETDSDGKLLSYCPTFDNRAVHKTPEMVEQLRKGASHLKERIEVVANSPAGKSVNKVSLLCIVGYWMS